MLILKFYSKMLPHTPWKWQILYFKEKIEFRIKKILLSTLKCCIQSLCKLLMKTWIQIRCLSCIIACWLCTMPRQLHLSATSVTLSFSYRTNIFKCLYFYVFLNVIVKCSLKINYQTAIIRSELKLLYPKRNWRGICP